MKNSKKTSQTNVTAIAVMENNAAFDAAMAELTSLPKNLMLAAPRKGSPVVILTPRTGKNGTKLPNRLMYDKLAEAVARDQKVVIDFSIGTCDFEFKTATTGVYRANSFASSVKSALKARGVYVKVRRKDEVVTLESEI